MTTHHAETKVPVSNEVTFHLPQPASRNLAQPLLVQVVVVPQSPPEAPDKEVKLVVPQPGKPVAAVVYGPAKGLRGRDICLLEHSGGESQIRPLLSNVALTGLVFRPGYGQFFRISQLGLECFSLTGESLGWLDNPGIHGLAFKPGRGGTPVSEPYFFARSAQNGLCGFWIKDAGDEVKIQPDTNARFQGLFFGRYGALDYSACGTHLFVISGEDCSRIDGGANEPEPEVLIPLSEADRPFVVACQPDPAAGPYAVFAGHGQYAHCIGKFEQFWRKVKIAPDNTLVGATGLAFINADFCLGWRRGKLFVFSVGMLRAVPPPENSSPPLSGRRGGGSPSRRRGVRPKFTPRPEPRVINYFEEWTPGKGMSILSAQVLPDTKQPKRVIVYLAHDQSQEQSAAVEEATRLLLVKDDWKPKPFWS